VRKVEEGRKRGDRRGKLKEGTEAKKSKEAEERDNIFNTQRVLKH
jgi:hypothetical protein